MMKILSNIVCLPILFLVLFIKAVCGDAEPFMKFVFHPMKFLEEEDARIKAKE